MPRETISIPLNSVTAHDAMAILLSTITYPDPRDRTEREKLRAAFVRWAILERAKIDTVYAQNPQNIRPEIFLRDEKVYQKTCARGSELLAKRVLCATYLILPQFRDGPTPIPGFEPTVDNLIGALADRVGQSRESRKTIADRLWRPTKPVAHAALAYGHVLSLGWETKGRYDADRWLMNINPTLAMFFYPGWIRIAVGHAERFRQLLPDFGQFKIREQDTVRFTID